MVEASRSVLNRFIPDIYIHSDVYKGEDAGKSPGYALSLLAETTEGVIFCAEAVSTPRQRDPHSSTSQPNNNNKKKDNIFGEERDVGPEPTTPEDVALTASKSLLVEIQRGGCVDRKHQWLVLLYMVLGSEDVGKIRMGPLSPRSYVLFLSLLSHFIVRFLISLLSDLHCADQLE
jgi:RNA 3'-terminal phosphate cyclase-like protein